MHLDSVIGALAIDLSDAYMQIVKLLSVESELNMAPCFNCTALPKSICYSDFVMK